MGLYPNEPSVPPTPRRDYAFYARDLAERVVATFVQAFIAALSLQAVLGDVDALRSAGIAGVAAVLSLLKGLVAKGVGDSDSASLVQ